jgi:hypothetical protein
MNKIYRRKLLHQLTTHLLEQRGYPKNQTDYDIEWDAKEPDSQYSMCYEDVEVVIDQLSNLGYEITPKTAPHFPASQTYIPPNNNITLTSSSNVKVKY